MIQGSQHRIIKPFLAVLYEALAKMVGVKYCLCLLYYCHGRLARQLTLQLVLQLLFEYFFGRNMFSHIIPLFAMLVQEYFLNDGLTIPYGIVAHPTGIKLKSYPRTLQKFDNPSTAVMDSTTTGSPWPTTMLSNMVYHATLARRSTRPIIQRKFWNSHQPHAGIAWIGIEMRKFLAFVNEYHQIICRSIASDSLVKQSVGISLKKYANSTFLIFGSNESIQQSDR